MGSAATKSTKSNEMNYRPYLRGAYHAGSWYSGDFDTLDKTLSEFLNKAAADASKQQKVEQQPLRAVICPHAGYSYSGPTAAYSYYQLQQEINKSTTSIETILILHPSHHVYLDGCAVSGATTLETPCGNLQVDNNIRQEILKAGELDPDQIHTPGIYVNRIIKGKNYSRAIENLTVREK